MSEVSTLSSLAREETYRANRRLAWILLGVVATMAAIAVARTMIWPS